MSDQTEDRVPEKKGFSTWHKVALWLGGATLLGLVAYSGVLGDTLGGAATAIAPDPQPMHARTSATAASAQASTGTSTDAAPAVAATTPSAAATAEQSASTERTDTVPRADDKAPHATDDKAPHAADGGPRAPEPSATGSAAITADGKVILNLATEMELRKLPGIGHARAQAILGLRDKLGRFRRVEELLRVKGIGKKRLATLRSRVVLDPP
ncbi:MAG: ComEA family DNA-binding protein [Polyangiaceae bacterium]